MKKLMTTMMGAMLVTISAIAQVTPMVLGDKHAMLRVDEKSKYILLPVQETEEIAAIAVLDGSNNMVQRMNVKLAVDRVDYFVPYELKGAKLFDIEFHGDRRQKGAVSEFTCWKEITFTAIKTGYGTFIINTILMDHSGRICTGDILHRRIWYIGKPSL